MRVDVSRAVAWQAGVPMHRHHSASFSTPPRNQRSGSAASNNPTPIASGVFLGPQKVSLERYFLEVLFFGAVITPPEPQAGPVQALRRHLYSARLPCGITSLCACVPCVRWRHRRFFVEKKQGLPILNAPWGGELHRWGQTLA